MNHVNDATGTPGPAHPQTVLHPATVARSGVVDATRINNFDLVRLYGALQVAVLHAMVHLHASGVDALVLVLGYFPGVPIFFAVSGFLVSLSLERATSLRQYFLNRALRIFPALWVCFILSLIIVLIYGIRPPSLGRFFVWASAQLTIVQFYNPDWLRGFGVGALNGSLWTIPVELQFYAVLPLLALWARAKPKRWVVLTVLAAVLLVIVRALTSASAESFEGKLAGVTLAPFLFYFLVGAVLRHVYTARPSFLRGQALKFALIYGMWIAIEIVFGIQGATGNELNIISIVLLSALVVSVAFTNNTLSSRLLGTTDISYGLYIYHMPFVNLFLALGVLGAVGVVSSLTVSIAVAALSWFCIERPALALKHYTLKRRG
jgi:peptidoglycan/LPS O-acetylase OafA/YrhL